MYCALVPHRWSGRGDDDDEDGGGFGGGDVRTPASLLYTGCVYKIYGVGFENATKQTIRLFVVKIEKKTKIKLFLPFY